MTRSHGYTFAAGLVGGLWLDHHTALLFCVGLIIGATLVYVSRTIRAVGRAGASRVAELHTLAVDKLHAETDRKHAEIDRKRAATLEAQAKVEHRIRRADEQKAEVKRAYIDGAIDGTP